MKEFKINDIISGEMFINDLVNKSRWNSNSCFYKPHEKYDDNKYEFIKIIFK